MSDGARKEVADSTDSAAYFGPMSEAKQNHEAMLQLTDTFEPEQNIAFGSRRIAKSTGKVGPHYLAAVSKREVWSWIPELWRYEMARSETLYWMIQPLWPDIYKRSVLVVNRQIQEVREFFEIPETEPDPKYEDTAERDYIAYCDGLSGRAKGHAQ